MRSRRGWLSPGSGVIRSTVALLGLLALVGVLTSCGTAQRGEYPPLPSDAGDTRVRPAVPVTTSGPHAFRRTTPSGRPVGFDPCRPVHYVVNTANMPEQGLAIVQGAVAEISEATGLEFHYDGTTDEPPVIPREPVQVARYGDRWAPVLIAWADQRLVKELAGVSGYGASHPLASNGPESERYVTGVALLNSNYTSRWAVRRDGAEVGRGTVMHMLALALGLGHVVDQRELMSPAVRGDKLGPGDREGLARIGAGPCFTDA